MSRSACVSSIDLLSLFINWEYIVYQCMISVNFYFSFNPNPRKHLKEQKPHLWIIQARNLLNSQIKSNPTNHKSGIFQFMSEN